MSLNELNFTTIRGNEITLARVENGVHIIVLEANGTQHQFMLRKVLSSISGQELLTSDGIKIPVHFRDAERAKAMLPPNELRQFKAAQLAPFGFGVFALLGIALLAIFITNSSSRAKGGLRPSAQNYSTLAKTYSMGQTVKAPLTDLMVSKALLRDKIGVSSQNTEAIAGNGKIFLVIEFSIKNTSTQPLKIYQFPNLILVDPNGIQYSQDISKSAVFASEGTVDRAAFGDLPVLTTARTAVVFVLPKSNLKLEAWHILTSDGAIISFD